jgi:hypothetical protein
MKVTGAAEQIPVAKYTVNTLHKVRLGGMNPGSPARPRHVKARAARQQGQGIPIRSLPRSHRAMGRVVRCRLWGPSRKREVSNPGCAS